MRLTAGWVSALTRTVAVALVEDVDRVAAWVVDRCVFITRGVTFKPSATVLLDARATPVSESVTEAEADVAGALVDVDVDVEGVTALVLVTAWCEADIGAAAPVTSDPHPARIIVEAAIPAAVTAWRAFT